MLWGWVDVLELGRHEGQQLIPNGIASQQPSLI
jgi:hypothetical protein